LIVSCT
jgi:hypothetical protein